MRAPIAPPPALPSHLVLLGHPVSHSMSPRFQQRALDVAGINIRYTARDTPPEQFETVLRELAESRAAGNVTIPHKERMVHECVHLTPLAQRVGAVNTFWHTEQGELVGHNTDVSGVLAAMKAVIHVAGETALVLQRVAIVGAGGAAASALVALHHMLSDSAGAITPTISIYSRTRDRAERLVEFLHVPARVVASAEAAVADADLVINASPVGMQSDFMPVRPESLVSHAAVLDLVYKSGETAWVRACRARGHRAEDGLRMLVEQGAEAFRCWFGVEPDVGAMWSVLEPRPFL